MTIPEWPEKVVPNITYAMLDLLECACDALGVLGQGYPCHCGITSGDQPQWGYCTDCGNTGTCGMGFIRPGSAFRYSSFPNQDDTADGCAGPMAYELQVGVVRCFPTIEEDGSMPPAEETTTASLMLIEDMIALRTAIECCDSKYLKNIFLGAWQTSGPQGGCVQGDWTVIVDPSTWGR